MSRPAPTPQPRISSPWLWPSLFAVALVAAAGVAVYGFRQPDKKDDPPKPRYKATVAAPELEGGVASLNTPGPLPLKDLRGKVVVLDFWTFCCINCIHTMPDLARLEKKYANELVVIGVHSAKFENERDTESIRKAVLRYEIKHPVVNDA